MKQCVSSTDVFVPFFLTLHVHNLLCSVRSGRTVRSMFCLTLAVVEEVEWRWTQLDDMRHYVQFETKMQIGATEGKGGQIGRK